MRKALIFSVILLFVGLGIHSSADAGMNAGLKLGLSAANFGGADKAVNLLQPGARLGASGGGYINFKTPWTVDFASAQVNIQAECLYTMRGAKYTTDLQSYTFAYDYLEFPVLLKLTSTKEKSVKASLYFGASAGMKMKGDVSTSSTNLTLATSMEDTLLIASAAATDDGLNSYDAGLILGADFDLVNEKFLFDVRYYMGMTKIAEGTNPPDVKNNNLSIWLGYKF